MILVVISHINGWNWQSGSGFDSLKKNSVPISIPALKIKLDILANPNQNQELTVV
jgi:hypothetical protein